LDKEISISKALEHLENLPKKDFSESIRIIIPRVLYTIYAFRSKRGGSHIKEIDPSRIGASYVVSACDWVMAEFIRLHSSDDTEKIEKLMDSFVDKKIPVLEKFGDDFKVLDPSLSVPDKIFLILYKTYPSDTSITELRKWAEASPSYVNTVLKRLDKRGLFLGKLRRTLLKDISVTSPQFPLFDKCLVDVCFNSRK